MYCDIKSTLVTYSYTNLVTTGSMALPPSVLATITLSSKTASSSHISATKSTASASFSSSNDGNSPTTVGVAVVSYTPNTVIGDPDNPEGQSRKLTSGAITGITIGGTVGAISIVWSIMVLLRRKRMRENYEAFKGNEGFMSGNQQNPDSGNMVQKDAQTNGGIARTNANDENDYLSPIERERLARINEAREAARLHEVDGSPSTTGFPHSENGEVSFKQKKSWWKPPQTTTGEPKPSSRWSASNAPTTYKAYQPNANEENTICELPGIRHIPSNDEAQQSTTSMKKLNQDGVSPMIGSVGSPMSNASTFAVTPLLGTERPIDHISGYTTLEFSSPLHGTQSLLSRSPPDPSATIQGPLKWPDTERVMSSLTTDIVGSTTAEPCKRDESGAHNSSVGRSLTNATGGNNRWISPEVAMAEGYNAGSNEEHMPLPKETNIAKE